MEIQDILIGIMINPLLLIEITVFKPFSSSTRTRFIVIGGGYESNKIHGIVGQGVYNATESHTGMSFDVSTGTVSISHIEVYGIK